MTPAASDELLRAREEATHTEPTPFGWLAAPTREEPEADLGPDFPELPSDSGTVLVSEGLVTLARSSRPERCELPQPCVVRGDRVVVDTGDGAVEVGLIVAPPQRVLRAEPLRLRVLRKATEADLAYEARQRLLEAEALKLATEVLLATHSGARAVRVMMQQGSSRIVVQLAAEERLELRELSRRLSAALHGRVEVRVVGARDSARVLGGVGPCGLQLCCNSFLRDFAPVTLKMAKDQGLAPNPARVAGVCGKLMCCLVYEEAWYRARRAGLPRPGRLVETPVSGQGIVRFVDVSARTAVIALPNGTSVTLPVDQLRLINRPEGDPA